MLTILQITYISLMTVPLNTPMFSAVTSLAIANNGYNILSDSAIRPFEDVLSDSKVKGMLLFHHSTLDGWHYSPHHQQSQII
jgi:hypothetical protein